MKKCIICKEGFTPKFRTTERHCDNIDCKVKWSMMVVAKKKEKEAKENRRSWNKEKLETKDRLKTLSDYEREAKKSFQKWVRLRDKDLPCISCGNSRTTDWAGGHYFSAGMYSGLMFDERNCHKQCNTYCNKNLSGNLLEYRKGLIARFGLEFVDKLESESDSKRNYKFTKQELIAKKLQYDIKIKELG